MKIGYARISRGDHQNLDAQIRSLTQAGCEKIYEEKASGAADVYRPELRMMLYGLKAGDEVIVWKIDRLSRSLSDLMLTLAQLEVVGVTFRSLTEPVDTSSPAGRMVMQLIGTFAEFEREIIRERTMKGLEMAKLRGRKMGRRPSLSTSQKAEIIRMLSERRATIGHAAALFRVSKATIKRALAEHRASLIADRTLEGRFTLKVGRPRKAALEVLSADSPGAGEVMSLEERRARAAWDACVPVAADPLDRDDEEAA